MGVRKAWRFRGRLLRMQAIWLQRDWVRPFIVVRLGRYWRMRPLVFSLVPRLPGVIRGGEVEQNAGGLFDVLVGVELGSVVNGDGAEQVWLLGDQVKEAPVNSCGVAGGELSDQNAASEALDQSEDAVVGGGADHGVHLPVAELLAVFDRERA